MATGKEIKARLKSIKNTKKITKAMELVAGAKMRRAIERAQSSRTYSTLTWDLAIRLAQSQTIPEDDYLHRFFTKNPTPKKYLIILFTSNRGLCGAFNSNVVKKVVSYAKEKGAEKMEFISIGKRGVNLLGAHGIECSQAYPKDESAVNSTSIANVATYAYKKFKDGEVDKVLVAYTDFKSSLVQEPVLRALFPFKEEYFIETELADVKKELHEISEYTFEPSQRKVLSYLVPRLSQIRLYHALLESNASEHSARMLAMKNASDSAGEMLGDLTLAYNRARQASITQEISEISAGMAAVS